MSSNLGPQGFEIDRERMPEEWPTHLFPNEFWEELVRENSRHDFLPRGTCLRANLAITATRTFEPRASGGARHLG